jgi:hypothetical protein
MMTAARNVGEGWHPILRKLEEELNAIDPDFELVQVKEKFGGLRYYAHPHTADPGFQQAINVAEAESFRVCEICGEPGETKAALGRYWIKTLCPLHRGEDEARYEAEGNS